jgi:hypothetical protein
MQASGTLEQLRTAYEVEGMTIEQICQDFSDLQPEAVKAALISCSSKYRKDCGVETRLESPDELNFDNDQLKSVNQVIYELALGAEDEHLRFKAATYVRDDKKGRKEVAALLRDTNRFNLNTFNILLQQGRQMANGIKQQLIGDEKVTDV